MPFCTSCGKKLDIDDSFCPHCGNKTGRSAPKQAQLEIEDVEEEDIEEYEPKRTEPQKTRRYNRDSNVSDKKPRSSGGFFKFILVLIGLGLIGAILFSAFASILGSESGRNTLQIITDPCESAFNSCNHSCGEGILSSVCKEKCSYNYRDCQSKRR